MKNKNWLCIEIQCPEAFVDDLASEVASEFESGVEIIPEGVRFYVEGEPGEHLPENTDHQLRELLHDFHSTWDLAEPLSFRTFPLVGDDWANRWKEYFKPLRIGRRFVVCPTWEQFDPGPGDLVIRMDPGMAFGTGQHETTRLCLEWLEEWAEGSERLDVSRLADVGTGSGILAMGAALLGFGAVMAVDIDPEALGVATENVALNRLEEIITLQQGSASDLEGRYDVVLANIQALPLVEMAGLMADRVREGGKIALSGILLEQRESVKTAYEAAGVEFVGEKAAGEWCLLAFEAACRERA